MRGAKLEGHDLGDERDSKGYDALRYRLGACEGVDAVRKSRGGIDVGKILHQM